MLRKTPCFRWLLLDTREFAVFPALWAIYLETIAYLHQVIQAGIVVRESLEKVSNRELFSHHLPPIEAI